METGIFKGYETSLSDPGILWIRFNRPERKNGMTSVMKRELIETLTQAQMDDGVRVLVFVGSLPKHVPIRQSILLVRQAEPP